MSLPTRRTVRVHQRRARITNQHEPSEVRVSGVASIALSMSYALRYPSFLLTLSLSLFITHSLSPLSFTLFLTPLSRRGRGVRKRVKDNSKPLPS